MILQLRLILLCPGDANATLAEVIQARTTVDDAMKEARIALQLAKTIQIRASNDTDHVIVLIEVRFEATELSADVLERESFFTNVNIIIDK